MRTTDRAMSNIESHPEGFNALRRMCVLPSSSLPPCCIRARAHARVHGVRALVCTAVHGAVEYSGYRMGATTVAREHCGRYQNVQEPLMDATSGAAQVGLDYR